jgi:hypothetical protein
MKFDRDKLFGLYPSAASMLGMMFNEDGELWAGSADSRKIVNAVAPMYSNERLSDVVVELNALVSGQHSEDELEAFIDRSGVRMNIGPSTVRKWLASVRDQIEEFRATKQ